MIDKALVKAALLQYADEIDGWPSFSAFTNYRDMKEGKTFEVPGLGEVKVVAFNDYDYNKSYDGWSEDIWIVFEVQGYLYKATGTHTSYTGSEWEDELQLVKPTYRQVIDYVPAQEIEYL